jgi:UDP-2-acetamido-3-amino-2,3-dideoxy-glucuronate N-acetyltransferase
MNIAIVGLGVWGKNHLRVFNESNQINKIKLWDPNKKQSDIQTYKSEFAKNYEEILNDEEIKAVSICSIASTHYSLAKSALEAGKHVFVEKPMTLSLKEAKELIVSAKKNKRLLIPGHIFRFDPAVEKLKEIWNSLGNIRFLASSRIGLTTPRKDCGVIFDFATHDVDISCYLLGQMPKEVFAISNKYNDNGFEDVAFINLYFKKEITVNIAVSWLSPKKIRELLVVGDKKSAKIDYMQPGLTIFDKTIKPSADSFGTFKLLKREGNEFKPYIKNEEPLKKELMHFVDCILNKKDPIIGGADALKTTKIIEAVHLSIREKRCVKL